MNRGKLAALCAAVVVASCGCGDGDPVADICDAGSLERALSAASSGDVVEVGACRIEGQFRVPAGVTLRGRGIAMTTLASTSGDVVTLSPGELGASLEDVSVESGATIGVVARGAGEIAVRRVRVSASRGYGIGAEDVTAVTMLDVVVTGPVTADTLASLPATPTRETIATRGIVLLRATRATLTDVAATGFAQSGLYVDAGRLEWRGGGASGNYGVGALVYGADAVLTDLDLGGTLQRGGEDTFAAVIANGASVVATGLDVSSNGAFGILQSDASATYESLAANGNGGPALWIQRCERAEVTGNSVLRDNELAAIVAVQSSGVHLSGATIADTRTSVAVGEGGRRIELGDGVHLLDSVSDIVLDALRLEGNPRVGVLIDGGGRAIDDVTLSDVSVAGEGDALGVIAQASIVGPDWDVGVSRDAVTAANDGVFTGVLDVVSIVGPDWTPPPDGARLD